MSSRPISSASMTSAPSSRRYAETVLLPLPRPPVSPTRNIVLYASAQFRGAHSVGHEHGDGQWADAAGDGRISAGDFKGLGMDVANDGRAAFGEALGTLAVAGKEALEFGEIGDAVDADVDDRRAGLHHFWRDESRAAD